MAKTIRDLEATLRKEFGFSSRRSKAAASVAWKALTVTEMCLPNREKTAAEFFTDLQDWVQARVTLDKISLKGNDICADALVLLRAGLRMVDESGGPLYAAAHLTMAIERLEETLRAKDHEKAKPGNGPG